MRGSGGGEERAGEERGEGIQRRIKAVCFSEVGVQTYHLVLGCPQRGSEGKQLVKLVQWNIRDLC